MKRLVKGGLIGAIVYLAIVLLSQNVNMSLLNQLVKPIFMIFGSLTLRTSGVYAGAIIIGFVVGLIATLIVGSGKKKKTQPLAKSKPKKKKKR